MARLRTGYLMLTLCGSVAVTGCDTVKSLDLFNKKTDTETSAEPASTSVKLVARDVEAPEAFSTSEQGLWDGRPSLGGVWVAYPDVTDPERVIIRNEANGKFVIGALFRDERGTPGPKLKVSSDAAAALGMLAGAPEFLNVTALRREEVPISDETADTPADAAPPAAPDKPIKTTALDPIAAANAALDRADASAAADASPQPAPTPAASPAPASSLAKPYIQIGLYSVQANATRTGTVLRGAGVVPNIEKKESHGKTYWRVTVGPSTTSSDRAAVMKKIKKLGYNDAYYVTN